MKINWGILSTAKIGIYKVIPAMQQGDHSHIYAIASRSLEKAKKAAKELNIPTVYGSYQELLEDPKIDAVYNPLPNHLHVPWTVKALQAGKHVLCEKPISLTAQECETLMSAAERHPKLKIMEAFMYRLHPQWQTAKEWVATGKIGPVITIQTFFSYKNVDPNNIRNKPDIGGGGMMDIGCYAISLSRFIFDKEPTRVLARMDFDPDFGTDRLSSGILDFNGGTSTFTVSTQLPRFQRVNIFGSKGWIEIHIPFNAPSDRPCKIIHKDENSINEITFDICDQYTIQGDLFSQAVLNDTPVPIPLKDALANMKVIDAMTDSDKKNNWVLLN
jgi:predicted dehydrogenase